jgi:hypothetical protein
MRWITLSLVVVGLAFLLAAAMRRLDARLGWAAVMLLIMTIAVPRHISGGDYADYRLVTTGLMVCCLAIAGLRRRAGSMCRW